VISDIKKIAEIAHKSNIPILVDEAHGAHLNFVEDLKNYEALNSGADIVVQSLHKTLPALTQCAIMHIQGNLISKDEVERALEIFETSSPSYILMSSIDECLNIIEDNGEKLFKEYDSMLKEFYIKANKLKKLKVLGNILEQNQIYDNGKIVIITEGSNINGKKLANILRFQYNIEIEMANVNYIIAMTSICDKSQNFERLFTALQEIDENLQIENDNYTIVKEIENNKKINEKENTSQDSSFMNYKQAVGKISQEYIWIYPPGIPIIAPGEMITQKIVEKMDSIIKNNIDIKTTFKKFPDIKVLF